MSEETTQQMNYDADFWRFAHGAQYVNSIRSSGYKNAAMAVGELVDNSIQHGATAVDILVIEREGFRGSRTTHQVDRIAVLDNGTGMDPVLLRRSLKLGDGTHVDEAAGMGKFGVGLPQASVSQAKRVDAWSWQNGIENAKHTFIDLSDPGWVRKLEIPEPDNAPIPAEWTAMAPFDQESGTLIVWSKVDRCDWKKSSTLFQHSEVLIGRMYRNWLSESAEDYPNVVIRLVAHDDDGKKRDTWHFKPNDPLYLLPDTSVVLPKGKPNPPFQQWGEDFKRDYEVTDASGTKKATVILRFSLADKSVRESVDGTTAGALPHGKHAKQNLGVSIVREGRELELDPNWTSKDPRNRWWGAEVQFGRALDDILGVTNNKQHADRLSSMASKDWDDFALDPEETTQQIKERLMEEDFSTFVCLDIASNLRANIGKMASLIEKNPVHRKSGLKRHSHDSPEQKGTGATKDRKDEGMIGESDAGESLPKAEREKELAERMEAEGYDPHVIDQVRGEVIDHGLKFAFTAKALGDDVFFSVESVAGSILISLNSDHISYQRLFSTLEDESIEDLDKGQLIQRVHTANDALKLMLEAWARLEDEASGPRRNRYKDIRADWGRIARDFLTYGDEDET